MLDRFSVELQRGIQRYPQELWATLSYPEMLEQAEKEWLEFMEAAAAGDIRGEHGTVREALHNAVVWIRIAMEEDRRHPQHIHGHDYTTGLSRCGVGNITATDERHVTCPKCGGGNGTGD